MQRSTIVLLLLLFSAAFCVANEYNVVHLQPQQPLSSNRVTDIAQSKTGLLWAATIEGLNSFDGLSAYHHKVNDPTGMSTQGITAFTETAEGDFLLSTIFFGIIKYSPKTNSLSLVY